MAGAQAGDVAPFRPSATPFGPSRSTPARRPRRTLRLRGKVRRSAHAQRAHDRRREFPPLFAQRTGEGQGGGPKAKCAVYVGFASAAFGLRDQPAKSAAATKARPTTPVIIGRSHMSNVLPRDLIRALVGRSGSYRTVTA